jgi:outer membrane receptor protein involved in Fe transport
MNPRHLLPFIPFLMLLDGAGLACAQTAVNPPPASAADTTVSLSPLVVTGQLDQAREAIEPNLGATAFRIDGQAIQDLSEGTDAPFNQVLLRAPGVAQDSAANGDLHVRGEHANLQYRINDVLLPEGITGFGLELDPRFVDSLQLITGSLPAQYGFRTAGVVDIQTKSGAVSPGGAVELFGGSDDTFRPSFEYGGSSGQWSGFVDGSFDHNALGIENPTSSHNPLHDDTDQYKLFASESYLIDSTSRFNVIVSGSHSQYQVPDTPGLAAGTAPNGGPWVPGSFNSAGLNENQTEQNYYGVVTYQKAEGNLNYQISTLGRASGVHFTPDPVGDLYFNGVASDVDRTLGSGGLQGDASLAVGDQHTLRFGGMFLDETVQADSTTTVFPVDGNGHPTGPAFPIVDNETLHGLFAGVYLQDEWKITPELTANYGARFDVFNSSFDNENQLSPRLNFIWQPAPATTMHAGYARYFTPPPVENVSGSTVALFNHTSNASATTQDDPVKAERANYFDAGISRKPAPGWQVGLDGYYKQAKNQLDDGLFGQTLILSAFNYAKGEVYGLEFTASYTEGGSSSYLNLAHSVAKGEDWNSAQFLFSPADLAYVRNHWIFLDHDQNLTGTLGTAHTWKGLFGGGTRIYAEAVYGSGLRADGGGTENGLPDGNPIPNGTTVPAYCTVNVGVEQSFTTNQGRGWKARLDVVNLFDTAYELRDGTGVGVNAPQYGARLGFFGSLGYSF